MPTHEEFHRQDRYYQYAHQHMIEETTRANNEAHRSIQRLIKKIKPNGNGDSCCQD